MLPRASESVAAPASGARPAFPNSDVPVPEAQLAAIVRRAPVVVYALDERGIFTLFAGRGLEAIGLEQAEVIGRSIFEHYADYPDILSDVRAALAGRELSSMRQLGELWFETRYSPLRDSSGQVIGTVGVATDITASRRSHKELVRDIVSRKLAEERLARSEADFRSLLECSADAIAVQSAGRVSYVNPAFVAYLGYNAACDVLDRALMDFFHPRERDALAFAVGEVAASSEATRVMEHTLLCKDGSEVTAQVAIASVSFRGQPSVLITARDVSERRRMQAQLRAADRMATVGTLTASIAHEINNPLAALMGNLQLLHARAHPGEIISLDDVETLEDARDAASRLRHIVRDLGRFTRQDDEQRMPLDVSHVMNTALKLAVNKLRNRVTVTKDYRVTPLVDANEVRLGQVFLNLIVNAVQSFPDRAPEANRIHITTRSTASRVSIEISDNGSGIPPEILPRIFDPLFTTKPIGVGTGLGLSICRGIVTALGGEIMVESKLGKGTTFCVTLPESAALEAAPCSIWPVQQLPQPLRVLVVDDEPMIRRFLKRALEPQHSVAVVSSALDALEKIAADEEFDVVFCDLMMPEMSGMEFYEQVNASAPALAKRIIFMSGGVFSAAARAFLDRFSDRHLHKPFDLQQIQMFLESRRALLRT